MTDPAAFETAVAGRATRYETPCGDGPMVWRRWGTGGRKAVVFLHGGYGSWAHWIRNVEVLAERYDVWACDLPGLGESGNLPKPHSVEGQAAPIAEGIRLLDDLPKPIQAIAFSFGAMLTAHVALKQPELFASLAIVGTAGLALPRGKATELERATPGMSEDEYRGLQKRNLGVLMFEHKDRIDDLAVHLQVKNVRRARVFSPVLSRGDSLARALPDINVPLTAVWGEYDATLYPRMENAFDLFRRVRPQTEIKLFPNAGHWVQYEDAPAFNAWVSERMERA